MFDQLKHMPLMNSLLRRPPFLYASAMKTLRAAEAMGRDARSAWEADKVQDVLKTARGLKGYEHTRMSGSAEWPVLNKQDMLGREDEFTAPSFQLLVPAATGGTTGQPMRLARSAQNIAREQAAIDLICEKAGVNLRTARIAILRGDSIKPASDLRAPFWIDEGPSRRIFSAHHLNSDTILHYKAALTSFQPDVLFCYPSSLSHLLGLLENASRLHIPCIFSSSEMLPDETLNQARALLGADVIDFYGHAERVVCAYRINESAFRFLPGYGRIELLPDDAGLARIIATSLSADGQVLVRYDTGDLIRVPSHAPETLRDIALGERTFERVEGRASEHVELPDGRRVIGLNHIPRGVTGVSSVQMYRSAPRQIGLYIVPAKGFGHASIAQVMANFRQKFPASVEAMPIFVERPVRERNGKAPLLLRAPDPASIVLSSANANTHLSEIKQEYVA